MNRIIPALLAMSVAGAAVAETAKPKAVIHTSLGNITIELYPDKAPETVKNFIGLSDGSKEWVDPQTGKTMKNQPLFSGTKFHRTKAGFMIQGGAPGGNPSADPGFTIKGEENDLLFDKPGRVAMANKGGKPSTASSQFFITDSPQPGLNPSPMGTYTIFGQVVDGMDVVKKIAALPNQPPMFLALQPVTIDKVEVAGGKTSAADAKTTDAK